LALVRYSWLCASVILAGTNDIAGNTGPVTNEEIEENLLRPMSRIRQINHWMSAYSKAKNYVYLDYFSAMIDTPGYLRAELSDDGLHPNGNGLLSGK
jgi:acyl-CoA thioesterase-1